MGAGTVPALEVMKLRGRTAENFLEASWLVRRGGPGDLVLESSFTCLGMAVLLLGHGCCGEAKRLCGDGVSGEQSRYGILDLKPLHLTLLMCQIGMLTKMTPVGGLKCSGRWSM